MRNLFAFLFSQLKTQQIFLQKILHTLLIQKCDYYLIISFNVSSVWNTIIHNIFLQWKRTAGTHFKLKHWVTHFFTKLCANNQKAFSGKVLSHIETLLVILNQSPKLNIHIISHFITSFHTVSHHFTLFHITLKMHFWKEWRIQIWTWSNEKVWEKNTGFQSVNYITPGNININVMFSICL